MTIDSSAFAPRDVVGLIENVFPGIDQHNVAETVQFRISNSFMPQIVAILEAVARIPDDLLPIENPARLELFAIIAATRAVVAAWMAGHTHDTFLEYLPGINARHPLDALRRALLNCPSGSTAPESSVTSRLEDPKNVGAGGLMDDRRRSPRDLRMIAAHVGLPVTLIQKKAPVRPRRLTRLKCF